MDPSSSLNLMMLVFVIIIVIIAFVVLRVFWNLGSYFKSKSRRLPPRQEHEHRES